MIYYMVLTVIILEKTGGLASKKPPILKSFFRNIRFYDNFSFIDKVKNTYGLKSIPISKSTEVNNVILKGRTAAGVKVVIQEVSWYFGKLTLSL